MASRTVEKKIGGMWVPLDFEPMTDKAEVERALLEDIVQKKFWNARWCTRITRKNNYDGTATYKVYYAKEGDSPLFRAVYIVDHL